MSTKAPSGLASQWTPILGISYFSQELIPIPNNWVPTLQHNSVAVDEANFLSPLDSGRSKLS